MNRRPALALSLILVICTLVTSLIPQPAAIAQQSANYSPVPVGGVISSGDLAVDPLDPAATIVEEFTSTAGFTQTDPDVYIADGRVNWHVYRNGGLQYIYRSIPAFSGDVRLTVRGRVDGWSNNCAVTAGIGHATGPGIAGLSGISANFGYTGGGCPTSGPVILGGGVQLDYHESNCNFTGNWLWISAQTYYNATLTLSGSNATLSVPGIGTATGTRTYNGVYDKLFVGQNGIGDTPHCWGAIDSITVEPLGGPVATKAHLPFVLYGQQYNPVTVTPVQQTDANGNVTILLPQAELRVSFKDATGAPLANARVIAVTNGQQALVIGEDAQHRFYPVYKQVTLPTSTTGRDAEIHFIAVALRAVDAAISAYTLYQFLDNPIEIVDLTATHVDVCSTVEQMANTLGMATLLTWADPSHTSHVVGIVAGIGSELWLDDLLTDHWCARNLPHPALIRIHTYPDMETELIEVRGPCPDRPQVPICQRPISTLTGTVINARTGTAISGAQVKVDPAGPAATTDSAGRYTLNAVPVGYHTVQATRSGYVPSVERVQVLSTTTTNDFALSPVGTGDEYRFILEWGSDPRDLDSHLWLPGAFPYHIFYEQRGLLTSHPYAALDRDDTDSYGPETVTMIRSYPGTYQYAVYLYAGNGTLNTSDARVTVYRGSTPLRVVEVPATGSGRWWVVASVDGSTGVVAVQNYITSTSPGLYAPEVDDMK